MNLNNTKWTVVGTVLLVLPFTVSCATKKFVRQNVADLETKIGNVDKKYDQKTTELGTNISDLDRKTEAGIADAQKKAEDAGQQASKSESDAQAANALAQKGVDQATQVGQDLQNIDSFRPVKSETVLFKVARYTLTDEDKEQLDAFAQTVAGMKRYVISVKGFTDSTGSKDYNLALSQRRADAVVRYLTEHDKIPLIFVRYLGYGQDVPAADNHSSAGRKQNRRVVLTVLAPQSTAQASATQSSTTTAAVTQ